MAGFIACPFFTLKTQFQVQSNAIGAVGHQHQHRSLLGAIQTILKLQGVSGLYAGLPVFMVRCIALVGAQMTTYDWAKHQLLDKKIVTNGVVCHIMSSTVSAGAACACMQPFDLIGARMMNQPISADGKKMLYSGPIECLLKTIKSEGVVGLYKGSTANYLRMCPQYILTFVFFEQLMGISKSMSKPER